MSQLFPSRFLDILVGLISYFCARIHKFVINIPDGKYAIALFIDKNKNKKIDKNFIGIPKEQFGFSNNAMGKLSAPSFQQAMFEVAGDTIQNIELK